MTIVKTDTDVSNLVINELTESQYNEALLAGQINENELYFVGDVYSELTDGYHPTLFSFEWSDCLKNDIQWLRADTFSWQSGKVYVAAYQHLLEDLYSAQALKDIYDVESEEPTYDTLFWYKGIDSNASNTAKYKWSNNLGDTFYTQNDPEHTTADDTLYDIEGNSTNWRVGDKEYNIETETIGSYTVSYYRATDGHKIVLPISHSVISNIYDETGITWYYILDTTNQKFKLPRTKFAFTGLRNKVGNYVDPGLPNITGSISDISQGNGSFSGAFQADSSIYPNKYNTDTANRDGISFDASRSSSIYGASDTVQPPATQMYLYFYVGSYTKAAYEQTAGITTEVLDEKADNDLNNITNIAKQTIIGWGMPDLSAGVLESSQFILPCDALVVAHGTGGGSYKDIGMVIDNEQFSIATEYGGTISVIAPVGSVVQIYGTGTTEIKYYPLKGVQNA